uniref:DUF155 domain-containing protein n=1 Tax=Grammatophora oceanica TaxID=210454 RepID=A0A7S1VM87_9STRA
MTVVAVISEIMAQTVALDSYSDTVDQLLADFAQINNHVSETGNFNDMQRQVLFQVMAQNNTILLDLLSKLGIKDRTHVSWNMPELDVLHSQLLDEFEIASRFHYLEFKLDLIQQNAKFFLEIMHNQKAAFLEWAIVILICFECVLMCLEMSGYGQVFFEQVSLGLGWTPASEMTTTATTSTTSTAVSSIEDETG